MSTHDNIMKDPQFATARIYVGRLNSKIKVADLEGKFSKYGEITGKQFCKNKKKQL